LCPFSVLVQHHSGDGDEGDPRWITTGLQIGGRMITNLRYADDNIHFGCRTTGVGGSPRPSQPQTQPTHQHRQDQGNGLEQLEHVYTFLYFGISESAFATRRGYPTARERVVCTDGEMGASK